MYHSDTSLSVVNFDQLSGSGTKIMIKPFGLGNQINYWLNFSIDTFKVNCKKLFMDV